MYFNQYEVGERIRSLHQKEKMKIGQLAAELNCSREHLSRAERGERTVSIDLLIDIARYFNTSLDWLILGVAVPSDEARRRLLSVIEELTGITRELL